MKIAINTKCLQKDKLEGVGWFTYETLRRITTSHPEHEFVFFFDRQFDASFIFSPNITPVIIPPRTRHLFLRWIWFEYSIPRIVKKIKPSIFVSPDGFLPLKITVPSLTVIHDLSFEHRPNDLPALFRNYCRHFFPRFARKATRIVTVSSFSKEDIIRTYGIKKDKIDVAWCGVNQVFKPVDEHKKKSVREQYTGGHPFFICTGALHPRKNIENLMKAFDQFKCLLSGIRDYTGIKLVFVGNPMFLTKSIFYTHRQLRHRKDIIFTGRLPNEELVKLTASAEALLLVSHFEGFGIPLLEAMNCDVPIIVSDCTALPEVAGSAGLYIQPDSFESIAVAMHRILDDSALKQALIENGKKERERFSWDITANTLWKSIEEVSK
ncbi:MAG: glycosyltransferase family 4 protein [Desulfamplus sp.]|nr:glycosyltransferase family 4 protein [Desulfamplus sp.]